MMMRTESMPETRQADWLPRLSDIQSGKIPDK
jgi:hypothetical protein